jgi:acyl carrier protein
VLLSRDRLTNSFILALGLPAGIDVSQLEYRSIPQWDSLAHLNLVTEIESEFDVMLDVDDVLGLRSFEAAVEILERLGVDFGD